MNSEDFFNELKRGNTLNCPCCKRYAQIYKRRIHATVAYQLIKLLSLGGFSNYVHTNKLVPANQSSIGDFSKAKYFGLIEEKANADSSKRTSGYWKLTNLGMDFVRGFEKIPSYVLIFDDCVIEFDDEMISITDCLGDKFNYSELMLAV